MPAPGRQTIVSATTLCLFAIMIVLQTGCASNKPAEVTQQYAFWPPAPDEPRIQFLRSFNSSTDVAPRKSGFQDLVYGTEQEQSLWLSKPYGVAMWNGRIYACDVRGGGGVVVLDLRKQQTRIMGATGGGRISKAVDVAVALDGIKYVADQGRGNIAVFDPEDRFVRNITYGGWSPVGVAVYENELFVSDFKNQCVQVLDRRNGELLRVIGGPGGSDGHFIRPLSVAVDKDGNVLVTDVIRARIQKFDRNGTLLLAWGQAGNRPGTFVRPKHLGVSSDGVTYIVDAAFNNVQLFDEEGKIMMFFGSPGAHPGAMDLPAGLAVHEGDIDLFKQYIHPAFEAERLIIVTNQFGPQKVSVYAQGRLREGFTVADITAGRTDVTASKAPPMSSEMAHGTPESSESSEAEAEATTQPASGGSNAP